MVTQVLTLYTVNTVLVAPLRHRSPRDRSFTLTDTAASCQVCERIEEQVQAEFQLRRVCNTGRKWPSVPYARLDDFLLNGALFQHVLKDLGQFPASASRMVCRNSAERWACSCKSVNKSGRSSNNLMQFATV